MIKGMYMKCPWKNNSGCVKKCAMGIGLFILSVLGISVLIKLISLILSIFSNDHYLNTGIVVIATVITLIAYYKCCSKSQSSCCDDEESKKECSGNKDPTKSTSSEQK